MQFSTWPRFPGRWRLLEGKKNAFIWWRAIHVLKFMHTCINKDEMAHLKSRHCLWRSKIDPIIPIQSIFICKYILFDVFYVYTGPMWHTWLKWKHVCAAMNINGLNYLLNKQFDFFRKKISESIGPFFCPSHSTHAWVASGSIHPSLFDMHYLKE
jgi:hypothetical protein